MRGWKKKRREEGKERKEHKKKKKKKKGEIPSFPKLIKVSDFILFSYITFHF